MAPLSKLGVLLRVLGLLIVCVAVVGWITQLWESADLALVLAVVIVLGFLGLLVVCAWLANVLASRWD